LRAKAQATGSLKSSQELNVTTVAADTPPPPPAPPPPGVDPAMLPPPPPADYISIAPTDPDVYYVPIYDPSVVYGPWGWPDYEPFYWYPPGYVIGAAVIGFGVGFFVGSALWCHYNWHGGGVSINVVRYNQFNRTNLVAGRNGFANWQFNAAHRGTVGFQNAALRQQFGGQHGLQGGLNHNFSLNNAGTKSLNAGTKSLNSANFRGGLNGTQGATQGNRTQPFARTVTGSASANANFHTNVNQKANVNHSVNTNFKSGGSFKPGGGSFKPAGNFAHNVGHPGGGGGGGKRH
jgi:hypothetical protein